MDQHTEAFFKIAKHPAKFRMFLFRKIPSAFFSGVKIKEIDAHKCKVSIPYRWFSQNPFRSTYFACLSMAAETSSGILAMAHTYKSQPRISMLVIKMEAEYFKKATGLTTFTCGDGKLIEETIQKAKLTGGGQQLKVKSEGRDESGELIAMFYFTWSFKTKLTNVQM